MSHSSSWIEEDPFQTQQEQQQEHQQQNNKNKVDEDLDPLLIGLDSVADHYHPGTGRRLLDETDEELLLRGSGSGSGSANSCGSGNNSGVVVVEDEEYIHNEEDVLLFPTDPQDSNSGNWTPPSENSNSNSLLHLIQSDDDGDIDEGGVMVAEKEKEEDNDNYNHNTMNFWFTNRHDHSNQQQNLMNDNNPDSQQDLNDGQTNRNDDLTEISVEPTDWKDGKMMLSSGNNLNNQIIPEYAAYEKDNFTTMASASLEGTSPFAPASPSSMYSSSDEEMVDREDDIAVFPEHITPTSPNAANFHPVAPTDMDSVVAKQMAKLSMQDREKVLFDIHGVSADIPETPELLETKLQEFQHALSRLSSSNTNAMNMAMKLNRSYVDNREFRLSFLRASLWDVHKAVLRFTRYFQAKLDLFGRDLLVKDITQDDLDDETMDALYSGLAQYLPLRDRAGRLIHISFYHPDSISLKAKMKRTFYMSMVSAEDVETQRKGRVAIGYLAGQDISSRPRNDWQVGNLLNSLPVRMEAIHLCHDTKTIWSPIFAVFKYAATLFTRLRIREHYGSNKDCMLSLQTFGIPITRHCFPLEEIPGRSIGRVSNVEHTRFWQKRRNLERMRKRQAEVPQESLTDVLDMKTKSAEIPSNTAVAAAAGEDNEAKRTPATAESETNVDEKPAPSTSKKEQTTKLAPKSTKSATEKKNTTEYMGNPLLSRISVPGRNDVLLGRGKGFYQHTGNISFRHWIESRSAAYDNAATASEKKKIMAEVIQLVEEQGGRFLKDDKQCGWIQVSRETARQKVAHVFRSLRPVVSNNTTATSIDRKSSFVAGQNIGDEMTGGNDSDTTSKKRMRR